MRLAITAFIAGESFLLFLPAVPANYLPISLALTTVLLLTILSLKHHLIRIVLTLILAFTLGFCWTAHYADQRLSHVLSDSLDGAEFELIGRVDALPQGNTRGVRFAFEVEEGTDRRRLRYIKSGEVATGGASEAIHDMQTRGLGTETLRPAPSQRRAR